MATHRSFPSMLNEKSVKKGILKEKKQKSQSKSLFDKDEEWAEADSPAQIAGSN